MSSLELFGNCSGRQTSRRIDLAGIRAGSFLESVGSREPRLHDIAFKRSVVDETPSQDPWNMRGP